MIRIKGMVAPLRKAGVRSQEKNILVSGSSKQRAESNVGRGRLHSALPMEGDGRSPVKGGTLNTTAIQNSVRAEIYRILSECYKEPCIEFAQDLAEGLLYQELEGNLKRLGISISLDGLMISASGVEHRADDFRLPEEHRKEGEVLSGIRGGGGWLLPSDRDKTADLLQSLQEIFYPLFVGPSPSLVLPVESVYKEWAREGNTVISSEVRGMLMGDPAIDMIRRYKAAGMEIPAIYKDMPDHLALLLEYMALLCESGAGEEGEGSQESKVRSQKEKQESSSGFCLLDSEFSILNSESKQQAEFLAEHLDWLPELNRLVYSFTEESRGSFAGKFYRTVADVTVAFVTHERESCLRRNGI